MTLAEVATCAPYHLCMNDYLHTQFDPAHLLSELGFTLVFDLLLIPLFLLAYKKLIKPLIVKDLHEAMDEEHGIEHHEDHLHIGSRGPLPGMVWFDEVTEFQDKHEYQGRHRGPDTHP